MITCAEVAAHFRRAASETEAGIQTALTRAVERGVERAKGYIGHQQDDWPALSPATIEGFRHAYGFYIPGKRELGFSGPDFSPLYRTGALKDSISGAVEGLVGVIGSDDRVAAYQEMGTPNARYPIPPRPFLAKAVKEETPELRRELGELAQRLLTPEAAKV